MKLFAWMGSIRSWIALMISVTFCLGVINGKLDASFAKEIIMLVMVFYFLKDRSYQKEPPKTTPKLPT